jgi:hypothetical protein
MVKEAQEYSMGFVLRVKFGELVQQEGRIVELLEA